MKILTVIGNRPQFIKAAAVSPRLRRAHEEVLVHTGQHFDDALSAVFFAELGLPAPDRELGVALAAPTARRRRACSARSSRSRRASAPDAVLVYGDTNSTLAGALAGAQAGRPGRARRGRDALVRPLDARGAQPRARRPRQRAAAVLLARWRSTNLRREGVTGPVELVGDVMVDVALSGPAARARAARPASRRAGLEPGEYVLATAHRAGNVDDPARLAQLVELLARGAAPGRAAAASAHRARGCATRGLLARLRERAAA